MADDIATHPDPVWRSKANFLIFADLNDHGMNGKWEQLWAKQLGENTFEICCIPFFTYGISLGDHVVTDPRADHRYVIREVGNRSGRRVLRLWLKGVFDAPRAELRALIGENHLLVEWYSSNLLGIDVPGDPEIFTGVQSSLRHLVEHHGAFMETGG